MKHAIQKTLSIVGGQSKLAAILGVSQPTVWAWLNCSKKGVTAEYCAAIEDATNGVVTKSDLRPDLWPPENRKSKSRNGANISK